MSRELDERCELMRACAVRVIDVKLWMDHFCMSLPGDVSCSECEDLKFGVCRGGRDPIVCMRGDPMAHDRRVHRGSGVKCPCCGSSDVHRM